MEFAQLIQRSICGIFCYGVNSVFPHAQECQPLKTGLESQQSPGDWSLHSDWWSPISLQVTTKNKPRDFNRASLAKGPISSGPCTARSPILCMRRDRQRCANCKSQLIFRVIGPKSQVKSGSATSTTQVNVSCPETHFWVTQAESPWVKCPSLLEMQWNIFNCNCLKPAISRINAILTWLGRSRIVCLPI